MNATAVGGRRSGVQQQKQKQQKQQQNIQRQYSDNNVFESSSVSSTDNTGTYNKWLKSYSSNTPFPSQQVEYSRMLRSMQREIDGEFLDIQANKEHDLTPEILDIHSLDTELLSNIPGFYNKSESFGDSDPTISGSKLADQSHLFQENNLIKSFPTDKEKSSSVAKIKVVTDMRPYDEGGRMVKWEAYVFPETRDILCINPYVRKRPLNKKEISKKEEDIIAIESRSKNLTVYETKLKVDLTEYLEKHEFVFDSVLDEDVSNVEVYHETVEPIVPIIFQRTKATCFAYGQTGSGKTYTMQPLPLKASQDILRFMDYTYRNQGFHLYVSFFEIYGGKLFDLLNDRRKLCMREDGKQQVCIVGLQEFKVSNVDTVRDLIEKGNACRSTGTTGANEESSRSHAILQLAIKRSSDGSETKPARLIGKLSFIDLAGSERGADTTDNDKQTRIEGAEINKSLLALKECIRALDSDQVHIPFRGSKLTEVLRDSFIGNSRTVMISCVSPNSGSCEHTLNTLRYADRVKSLSKGNNYKKDLASTVNMRESSAFPIASTVPSVAFNGADFNNETKRFGWSRQLQNETSQSFSMDRKHRTSIIGSNFTELCKQEKLPQNRGKTEPNMMFSFKKYGLVESFDANVNNAELEENLNSLLKEEEDLVTAHMKQVAETIDIIKEETKLLVEADKPENLLGYISGLNTVILQKAAGILNLQTRLANFKKLLNENNDLFGDL